MVRSRSQPASARRATGVSPIRWNCLCWSPFSFRPSFPSSSRRVQSIDTFSRATLGIETQQVRALSHWHFNKCQIHVTPFLTMSVDIDMPNTKYQWSTDNARVATVDNLGTVRGVDLGQTKIHVRYENINEATVCVRDVYAARDRGPNAHLERYRAPSTSWLPQSSV